MPVATAIVSNGRVDTVLAACDMPAEGWRAAALDRRHHLQLVEAHMAGIGLPPCRTMLAEDIRDLQRRARHARRASGGRRGCLEDFDEMIERADHRTDGLGGNAGVERRGVELGVPEQDLDHADIDALLQ